MIAEGTLAISLLFPNSHVSLVSAQAVRPSRQSPDQMLFTSLGYLVLRRGACGRGRHVNSLSVGRCLSNSGTPLLLRVAASKPSTLSLVDLQLPSFFHSQLNPTRTRSRTVNSNIDSICIWTQSSRPLLVRHLIFGSSGFAAS